MMQKAIWIGIIIFLAAATCWSATKALMSWMHWIRFSEQATAENIQWSMRGDQNGRYFWRADYDYLIDNQTHHQSEQLSSDRLTNYSKHLIVWVDPNRPEQATIERAHPLKSTLYLLVQCGVLIYFIRLNLYVKKNKPMGIRR